GSSSASAAISSALAPVFSTRRTFSDQTRCSVSLNTAVPSGEGTRRSAQASRIASSKAAARSSSLFIAQGIGMAEHAELGDVPPEEERDRPVADDTELSG